VASWRRWSGALLANRHPLFRWLCRLTNGRPSRNSTRMAFEALQATHHSRSRNVATRSASQSMLLNRQLTSVQMPVAPKNSWTGESSLRIGGFGSRTRLPFLGPTVGPGKFESRVDGDRNFLVVHASHPAEKVGIRLVPNWNGASSLGEIQTNWIRAITGTASACWDAEIVISGHAPSSPGRSDICTTVQSGI